MIHDVAHVRHLLEMVSQVDQAHRRAKDLYRARLAPDYNVFDFIEPDEMRLSKILAWLLDPRETHGQGSRFLCLFLKSLGEDAEPEECDRAQVQTESWISQGRLDVLVKTPRLHLAIENKPWAGDQDKQIARYFSHFDMPGKPKYKVVYLTSKGSAPPGTSISKEERNRRIERQQLYLWSYDSDILQWLAKCRTECQADRVLAFIDEFSRYIRAIFEGVRDRTMSDYLVDEIVKSEDGVAGAMQVISLADTIRKRLLTDLRQQLRAKLPDQNVEFYIKRNQNVELSDDPSKQYSGLRISYSELSPYDFCLEFQKAQFGGLVMGIGIRKDNENAARDNEAYNLLNNRLDTARQDKGWLWWQQASLSNRLLRVSEDWQASTEVWREIANHTLAEKVFQAFELTRAVLSDYERA